MLLGIDSAGSRTPFAAMPMLKRSVKYPNSAAMGNIPSDKKTIFSLDSYF